MSRYYRHNPDDHAKDEADCLRDWRRDAAAEDDLALPGLEATGVETLGPDEPARSAGESAHKTTGLTRKK